MKKLILILAMVSALLRAAADPYPNMKYWKPSEKTGYFTDGGNWDGDTVPGAGETAAVKDEGDGYRGHYVVKFPSGLTTISSLLYFATLYADSSVTLDTTEGGFYHVPAEVPANYKGFGFYTSGEDHFFNFESLQNNKATCSFKGGTIKAYADGDIFRLDVESGELNWVNPNGVETSSSLVLSKKNAAVTVKGHSSLVAGKIQLREGVFAVEGGKHDLWSDFLITDGDAGTNPQFLQSSGKIEQKGGNVVVGYHNGAECRFEMEGDAEFTQGRSNSFKMGAKAGTISHFKISGGASATFGSFTMNCGAPEQEKEIETYAVISNNARLTLLEHSVIGERTLGKIPEIKLFKNGKFNTKGILRVGYPNQGSGVILLDDNAELLAESELWVYGGSRIAVDGNAKVRCENNGMQIASGGSVVFADNAGLEAMHGVTVDGGELKFTNSASLKMNTKVGESCRIDVLKGGCVELDGGDGFISCLNICSGSERESVIRVKRGTFRSFFQGEGMVPLSVGGSGSKDVFEMQGGSLSIPRMARVGVGNTGEGYAVFRLSGGLFEINDTVNEANFNVADESASKGRVELLGGKLRCQYLRGWSGSKLHDPNATGRAELYADGGTLAPNRLTSDSLLKNFDDAVLGEKGLSVDTEYFNVSVNQAFKDEAGKSGLFVKTGMGTLSVLKESSHSNTLVNGGELYYSVPRFGRNLTVAGGASVSTVGNPASIEVASLTLGSDESIGYVKLDLGDKIVITGGSAGLKVHKGVIICDGLDNSAEHDIFDIRGEIDVDMLAEELGKIRCANSNKDKFISFVPVATEDGYTVRLKVADYEHSAATWKGTGSDWNSADNWDGGIPRESTIATFPAEAEVKTVTVGSDRAFEAKVTGGDYEFAGKGKLTLDKISVSGGSLNVAVDQTPNMGMEINVSENASVSFSAPVESGSGLDKIVKSGIGLLTLGSSPDWFGSWAFNGGKTVVTKASGLGAHRDVEGTVSLGAATLNLAMEPMNGEDEVTVEKALQINSGNTQPAIIDAEVTSVRFTKGISAISGGLIKKGSKDVTVELADDVFTITASNLGAGSNISDQPIQFNDETGVPPSAQQGENSPFGGLTVAEGTLRLTGSGNTTVNQKHTLLIGGGGVLDCPATLEVSGLKMNQGDSGVHCFVGGAISAGSAATNSILRVIGGSYFDSDTVNLARKQHDYSGERAFANHILAVTNATISSSWVINVGSSGDRDLSGSFDIGKDGVVEVRGTCINVDGGVGGTISDGGVLRAFGNSVNSSESRYGLYLRECAWGALNFIDGGVLDAKAVKSARSDPLDLPLTVNFNGGVFKVRGTDGVSMSSEVEKRTFNAGIKGMYIDVEDASSRHTVVMPVNGDGGIVKTGAGDLFAAKCVQVRQSISAADGVFTLNCTGVSRVEQGSLTIEAGAARTDLKLSVAKGACLRISGDQNLGAVSGGGTITSGGLTSDITGDPNGEAFVVKNANPAVSTLACTIAAKVTEVLEVEDLPLFENIVLSQVVVDLGAAGEVALNSGKIAIARIGDGVTADPARWTSLNRPLSTSVAYTLENGVVYANLVKSGLILFVR